MRNRNRKMLELYTLWLMVVIISSHDSHGLGPFSAPPRARQFMGKRSSSSAAGHSVPTISSTTVAELVRDNPLLASLSMFRGRAGAELLAEPVDITASQITQRSRPKMPPGVGTRRRTITAAKRRKGGGEMLVPEAPVARQLDNFDAIYQIFNATMFDMAEGEERMSRIPEAKKPQQPMWRMALPWGVEEETLRRKGTTATEGRFHRKEEKEDRDEDTTTPFEVTEALTRALEMSTTTRPRPSSAEGPDTLVGPEEFPTGALHQRLKYPWERERGEQAPPTPLVAPPPPLPPVVPGASFYVDQHVSQGAFGRDSSSSAPDMLVYDPNILQSRYGFGGMLPQMMPDGRLIRGQHGVHIHQSVSSAAFHPSTLGPSAAAVFFIPAPPRLSMARAVAPGNVAPIANGRGLAKKAKAKLGYWPSKKSEETEEEDMEQEQKQLEMNPPKSELVPLGGNHLKWVPAEVAEREVADAVRWPCQVDPPALLLADSAPPLAACFRRVRQCTLRSQVAPLARRSGVRSGEQCARECVQNPFCAALTFARAASVCVIFGVRNGTASVSGTRLVHHPDFDYLEPVMAPGGALGATLRDCWQEFSNGDELSEGARTDGEAQPKLVLVDSGEEEEPAAKGPPYSIGTTTVTVAHNMTATTAPGENCPADRDIVVFKSQGYRLAGPRRLGRNVGEPPPSVPNTDPNSVEQRGSETECIFSCLVNLAHGQHPFECLAATFDSVQGQCTLHGPGSTADGSVHLVPDPAYSHYEKGCIQMDLVELCRGLPIIRYPQKTLLGFALTSHHATSLVACLELCWAHNQNQKRQRPLNSSNFSSPDHRQCRSVVFFFEDAAGGKDAASASGHNCMLNAESRESAPAFFVDEHEALVDYASFDGCYEGEEEEEEEDEEEGGMRMKMKQKAEEVMEAEIGGGIRRKMRPKLMRLRPLVTAERRRAEPRKNLKAPRAQIPENNPRIVVAELSAREADEGMKRTEGRGGGRRRQMVDGQTGGKRSKGSRKKRRRKKR